MNELTPIEPRGVSVRAKPADVRFTEICGEACDILGALQGWRKSDSDEKTTLRRALTFYQSGQLAETAADLAQLARPATAKTIRALLVQTVMAFPNAAKADLAAFGVTLAEDIILKGPSLCAISAACRRLRQTHRFVPTISEFIEAIDLAEKEIVGTRLLLEQAPEVITNAVRSYRARTLRAPATPMLATG